MAYDRLRVTLPHEMKPSHWIQYVWAIDADRPNRILGAKLFDPDMGAARLTVQVRGGQRVRALAYCNEHGLWTSDVVQVPNTSGDGHHGEEL